MTTQKPTYNDVAKAADKVKSLGDKPSISNVQKEMGIYHSREIPKLLEQWYESQPEFQRSNLAIPSMDSNVDIIERQQELEKNISLVRATLEATADGILLVNNQGEIVDWNQQFSKMWRLPAQILESGSESLSFDYILDQVKDPQALVEQVQRLYEDPGATVDLGELHFKDGRIFERYSQPQKIGDTIVGRVWSFRDITERKLAEEQLRIRQRAVEASTHGVFIIDINDKKLPIIFINSSFQKITGYSENEVIGKSIDILQSLDKEQTNFKRLELAIRENQEEQVELLSYRRNGEAFWNEMHIAPVPNDQGVVSHYVGIMNDITERKEMEQQLIKQATHDLLTNLPNRMLLIDRVNQAIHKARQTNKKVALLFLDLDKFKFINDSKGHSMGDLVLQEVANRLLVITSSDDTVARIGGDEFVIMVPEFDKEEEVFTLSKKILESIKKPFYIEDNEFNLTASIGLSLYPRDGDNYEAIMKNADLAMYHAKDEGRNTFKVYDEELNKRISDRIQIETALRNALSLNELEVHYQPLVNMMTGSIIGTEALCRWKNKELGNVSPAQFIPLAEETGLILEIGAWVLENACKQTQAWHEQGFTEMQVAVNLSGKQFEQKDLVQKIQDTLLKTGFKANCLEIELTESLLIEDLTNTVNTLYQLKDMGVKIAIDDFGTGYSSLSYLKQFPVDKLKIDQSFVRELFKGKSSNEEAIVLAIINLAHSLNLHALAEGVETEAQMTFLKQNLCDYAQGYYFYKPAPAHEVTAILKKSLKTQ